MNNISIRKAAFINFISKYINIFIQLIINSVLARLLTPDDYGIVAVITVFTSFFTIIADMGIGPAIIQYKNLSNKQISDIFKFTVVVAVITAIGFYAFSYPLSIFYNNSIYIPLGGILSISILFNVVNMVPNAILLRNKEFKSIGVRTVIINTVGGVITILLSLKGAKYYALVINSLFVSLLTFSFNFYYSKIKLYKKFSFESINIVKEFSSYQFGFNVVNYFSRNLDNLLIGKYMGQIALGYYDKAYKLMLYPVQNLTSVITPVLHPILSEYHDDKDRIYEDYMKIVKILFYLGIFFSIFCYFSSEEIILIMFGSQWVKSIDTFKVLSMTIWIQMIMSSTGCIFQSLNDTKNLFKVGIITTSTNVVAIIIGVLSLSIETVGLCILISFSINLVITFYTLINKSLNKSFTKFLEQLKSGFIMMVIMIGVFNIITIEVNGIIFSISIKLMLAIISFVTSLAITNELNTFKRLLQR